MNSTSPLGGSDIRNGLAPGWLLRMGSAAAFAALMFGVWWARHVAFLAFAGFLLAVFLQTLASWIAHYVHLSYRWSLAIVTLGLVSILGLLAWLVGARVSQEFRLLSSALPASFQQLWSQFQTTPLGQTLPKAAPQAGGALLSNEVLAGAAGVTSYVGQSLADLIVVVFVGLYGAAQHHWYAQGLIHLVPLAGRARAEQVLEEAVSSVRWWLLGQLFAMIIVGGLTGAGLWMVGVRLPLALGVLAFLLEIIPFLGPFLSLIPAVLLAWADGPWLALWALGVFAVVHLVEGYVITPIVQLRTVHLPPAVHLLALVLLAMLGGIWGVLISAPLVVTVILLVRMLYVEDVLGDFTASPR